MAMLIDFAFYGGHPNDLAGAAGFTLLLIGSVMSTPIEGNDRSVTKNQFAGRGIVLAGALMVITHFLLRWYGLRT